MGYHYRAPRSSVSSACLSGRRSGASADSFLFQRARAYVCDGLVPMVSFVIANNCRDLQSYLSHLSLFLAPESKKFYILVDNRPWLKDLGPRSAHLWQLMVTKAPNYTSPDYRNIDLGSSSKCNNKMTMRPPIANTTQERAVNRTPEKRQRVPSAYNQFIK
ncbi:Axial regulator YABBY 5 [Camellia lanceoleosa]|uniref:Axial regulator YABBY 5 n=1 Tax=Camellia lanceoleosa TaxID=1840588 RepID=A0ACC0HD70_9ERIC|nr:Axial regulator YABBY 5 [Camellia lanceoleosa]